MKSAKWIFAAALPVALLAWQCASVEAATTAPKAKSGTAAKADAKPKAGPEGRAPGMGRGHRMEAMVKELNLTKAQQEKIKALNTSFMKKMQDIRASKLPEDQKRARAMENSKAHRDAVNKVLTPEQQKKMQKLMEEQRRKFPGPGGPGAPGAGPAGAKKPAAPPAKK